MKKQNDGIESQAGKNTGTEEKVQSRGRTQRKKVYERVRESILPKELHDYFKTDNWDLKLVRWSIEGNEDYRYLNRREKEGYEFVTVDELPDWYKNSVNCIDTRLRKGLVIMGDVCLMKVDTDLRNSRRKVYQDLADQQVQSVDVHVLEKKGFRNTGSKTQVVHREPKFQD